jgi:hypothetical protein
MLPDDTSRFSRTDSSKKHAFFELELETATHDHGTRKFKLTLGRTFGFLILTLLLAATHHGDFVALVTRMVLR